MGIRAGLEWESDLTHDVVNGRADSDEDGLDDGVEFDFGDALVLARVDDSVDRHDDQRGQDAVDDACAPEFREKLDDFDGEC